MRTITITVRATIELPIDRPAADYMRAVGNVLADRLPRMAPDLAADDTLAKRWKLGDVEFDLHGTVSAADAAAEPPASAEPTQGSLL